jgi:hypothetical protein
MPPSRGRRLVFDLMPSVLAIGYGLTWPTMTITFLSLGVVLMVWAGIRF